MIRLLRFYIRLIKTPQTYNLKFGHLGINHPVKNLETGQVEVTSQNHGFAVDADSMDESVARVTHINLNDDTVEGLRCLKLPAYSVQYHPEASPGPHDARYLFEGFLVPGSWFLVPGFPEKGSLRDESQVPSPKPQVPSHLWG